LQTANKPIRESISGQEASQQPASRSTRSRWVDEQAVAEIENAGSGVGSIGSGCQRSDARHFSLLFSPSSVFKVRYLPQQAAVKGRVMGPRRATAVKVALAPTSRCWIGHLADNGTRLQGGGIRMCGMALRETARRAYLASVAAVDSRPAPRPHFYTQGK